MLIKQIHKADTAGQDFVLKNLLSLRDYYSDFADWFDFSVRFNLDGTRFIYVAYDEDRFAGALILKKTKVETKICTLFVHPNYQFNHIGGDFLEIASQKLKTNKLPISLSDEVKKDFFNNKLFNFVLEKECQNKYCDGRTEYFGYIRYHENNPILRLIKRFGSKVYISQIEFLPKPNIPEIDIREIEKEMDEEMKKLKLFREDFEGIPSIIYSKIEE